MKNQTTYSIVYISPDPRLGDRIAIGLLTLHNGALQLNYSNQKLNSLKTTLKHKSGLISKSLKVLQKYVENIDSNHNPIFNIDRLMLTDEYMEKLSNYSNGLIQFQHPKLALLNDTFTKDHLYYSLFPEEETKEKFIRKDANKIKIESDFLNKVADEVHVNLEVNDSLIPNSYFPYHIDAIGKNGVIYIAKYFDFHDVKAAPVSHFFVLNEKIKSHYNPHELNKVMIFGEEPELNTPEHDKWDFLHSCEGYRIFHPDQAAEVKEIFLTSGAKKFLQTID